MIPKFPNQNVLLVPYVEKGSSNATVGDRNVELVPG